MILYMSQICIGILSVAHEKDVQTLRHEMTQVTKKHHRGIVFDVSWNEPILSTIGDNSLLFSLSDSSNSDNCEMLLLPNNCCYDESCDILPFKERMLFLQDIAAIGLRHGCCVEFFLGTSGTLPEEYAKISITNESLPQFLECTIGFFPSGWGNAVHLVVCPK